MLGLSSMLASLTRSSHGVSPTSRVVGSKPFRPVEGAAFKMKGHIALCAVLMCTALLCEGSAQEAVGVVSDDLPKPAFAEGYSAPYQLHSQDESPQDIAMNPETGPEAIAPVDHSPPPPPPPPDPSSEPSGNDEVTTYATVASGVEAVLKLDAHLPEVAAAYGRTAEDLVQLFATDKDLYIDADKKLFYACNMLPPQPAAAEGGGAADDASLGHHHHHHLHHRKLQYNADAPDPVASSLPQSATGVPLVHSRPSSTKKIYLDFDGHTTTGEEDG